MLALWRRSNLIDIPTRIQSLLLFCFLLFAQITLSSAQAGSPTNISIPINSTQIVYTPFLCDSNNSTNTGCDGAWRIEVVDGVPVASTTGPSSVDGGIVPQMFLQFQASALALTTSSLSNATINVTVSAGGLTVARLVDSGIGSIDIIDLLESEVTTLAITFIPGQASSARLDIGTIVLTVTNSQSSSSFLPTPTLPPSISLPSSIPSSTSTSSIPPSSTSPVSSSLPPSTRRNQQLALAIGLTIGLGLGLTVFSVLIFFLWRRYRWKRQEAQRTGLHTSAERSWF